MTVTSSDVRNLVESTDPESALVLEEGHVAVVEGDRLRADPSAFVLISRSDLLARLDSDPPSQGELERHAAMLDEIAASPGA